MVKRIKKSTPCKKLRAGQNIFKYGLVTLLCAFSTVILLFVVSEKSGSTITGFAVANQTTALGLDMSFVGIFLVLMIGFVSYSIRLRYGCKK